MAVRVYGEMMLSLVGKKGPVAVGWGVCVGLLFGLVAQKAGAAWPPKDPAVAAQLKSFAAEKEDQAGATNGHTMADEYKKFFAAAKNEDWLAVSNQFKDLSDQAAAAMHGGKSDQRLHGTLWEAIKEVWGGEDALATGNEKYSTLFARKIIDSIPPGSIYFGGTDPGRFIVTAMQKSQVKGLPFFTLTQNALADNGYLDYVRSMYGHSIAIPDQGDSEKCFQNYIIAARERFNNHQLKPGEQFTMKDGQAQIGGTVAVMEINGLLAKTIFDKNADRNFFLEVSFPLDWTYPYLEPHGLIFKLNRLPRVALSEEVVQQDHEFWGRLVQPMIGSWLNTDTSVEQVAAFADKVFVRRDFSGFGGDMAFIRNAYSHKMFAKERASIADLYLWRSRHGTDASEKKRMRTEADFAFRQAFALCPYSPEAIVGLVTLLAEEGRKDDARLLLKTATKATKANGSPGPENDSSLAYFTQLADWLK